MKSELSSCVIQKFNGYDLLRVELSQDEKIFMLPLDIVYEPTQNINEPIYCYFAPKIHLAFHTVYEKTEMEKKFLLAVQMQNSVLIVKIFLLNLIKNWKIMFYVVLARLVLIIHLIMVK